MVLFMVIWLKKRRRKKKRGPINRRKSHKEAESVNFMTTLSFCQEETRNPSNVAVINRQNSPFSRLS